MAQPLILPNPENATLAELHTAAAAGSVATAKRCLAIIMLLTGSPREQVLRAAEASEASVRRWVQAFNARGIDGLIVHRPGRPRRIPPQMVEPLRATIERPELVDRTFWTATAFHGYLKSEYRIECSYETVRRFFMEQGFRLQVPRPWPERQEEPAVQERRRDYLENLARWAQDQEVDLWFADETGVEGEPRPYRRWAPKGSEPRVVHNGDHIRMNVLGMVCPRSGEFFAIEASHCDTDVFQAFLDAANRSIHPTRRRNIVILDNAGWHKSAALNWGNFEPQYLPPYSPDLNPIEWVWLVMKKKWLNNIHCKTVEALIQRLDLALLDFIENPASVAAITAKGILQ